jgi:hypothetical protein
MGVMNRISRLGPLLLGLGLAGLLYGCGSGAVMRAAPPGATAGETATASPLPDLPTPVELSRTASAWNYAECHGADFLVDGAHNRITTKATLAGFNPDWRLNERHPLDDLAYAIYALHVPGFAGESKVSLLWFNLPPLAQTCWVGLGNQQHNRWDWFPLQDDSTVHPKSLAPYTSEAQQIYVAVVLLGEEPRSLNGLWVGEGTHLYYEVEDNDTADNANPLPPLPFNQVELTGSVGAGHSDYYDGDLEDWFTFNMESPSTLKIAFHYLSRFGASINYSFYQSDATGQPSLVYSSTSSTPQGSLLVCPTKGQYWLKLSSSGNGNQYQFDVMPSAEKFTEIEDNDSYQQANLIPTAADGYAPMFGCIGSPKTDLDDEKPPLYDGDCEDWYYFDLHGEPRVSIEFAVSDASGYISAELYASDGVTLIDTMESTKHFHEELRRVLPSTGKYYLRLHCPTDIHPLHADYVLFVKYGAENPGWYNWIIGGGLSSDQLQQYDSIDDMTGLEVDGLPALCWIHDPDGTAYYSRAIDEKLLAWTKPQPIAACPVQLESILGFFLVDGRPALVFGTHSGYTTKPAVNYYVIAADNLGEKWYAPVAIAIPDLTSYEALSATQVAGAPALCGVYPTGDNEYTGMFFYSRAEDASGDIWGQACVVDESYNPHSNSASMKVVNGHPAIAYSCYKSGPDTDHALVCYSRAEDDLGMVWLTHQAIYEYILVDQVDLDVWPSGPAVNMVLDINWEPRKWLVRAADLDGQTWNTPIDMDLNAKSRFTTLQLVDSVPRLVWPCDYGLMYSYAEEYDGSKWAAAECVDNYTGGQSEGQCLFDLKGQLGIAYVRNGLRFALRY